MKDKLIQIQRPNRLESSNNNYSNFKLTMNDPTLRKYLDMTLNRFSTKCSLLVNQIDDLKRELITQIEGLNEFFPASVKIPLPIVSPARKKRKEKTSEQPDFTAIIPNCNQNHSKIYLSTNPNIVKSDRIENETKTKEVIKQSEPYEKKVSITIHDNNEENMQLKINLTKPNQQQYSNSNNNAKGTSGVQLPSKIRALMCLSSSNLLCFEEKIKLSSLNQLLHKQTTTKDIIASSKLFLEEKRLQLISKKEDNLPSQTSQSSLNFIKKENENDLKNMNNTYNRAFYELVYILSGEVIPSNISYEHLYESVLRKHQVQSIKHLFLKVLLIKIVESPLDYSNEMIKQFNEVVQNHNKLISHNELLTENKSLSLFSFCLKEFYRFFQFETERRNEIKRVDMLLEQLSKWTKDHQLN